MNENKYSDFYKNAIESGLFKNVVPYKMEYGMIIWQDEIYGKNKHNLPHSFYLNIAGSNIYLVYHSDKRGFVYFTYDGSSLHSRFGCPNLECIYRHILRAGLKWPFLSKEGLEIISLEDLLAIGSDDLKGFILFNLNYFV
jgi:hypothetical protein